jgi:methylenetetrahydrofolate reductase (NADPH)
VSSTLAAMSPTQLINAYSLEMTAKDVGSLNEAAGIIPPGTAISVTFLPGEELDARVAAARRVKELGFVPVPHISARRLHSADDLELFLRRLAEDVGIDHAFVVAGDPPEPMGPFSDALAVIESGMLEQYGVRHVGISGYPEGHPDISNEALWQALRDKTSRIKAMGMDCEIMTQFAFDEEPVLAWVEAVRQAGVEVPIRIGIPGPASLKTLLRFAARCGVGASTKVMAKYGASITRLLNTTGPDKLVRAFAEQYKPAVHGAVHFHVYPFGGLKRTAEWCHEFVVKNRA